MNDLLSIPPKVRTVIYYVLGVATVVVQSADKVVAPGNPVLAAAHTGVPLLAALFLGVAASNVPKASSSPTATLTNVAGMTVLKTSSPITVTTPTEASASTASFYAPAAIAEPADPTPFYAGVADPSTSSSHPAQVDPTPVADQPAPTPASTPSTVSAPPA